MQWVDDMVSELDSDRYFRWFDSGDVYDIRLARKIYEVMKRTPWCHIGCLHVCTNLQSL
jgi:hypothetical protein